MKDKNARQFGLDLVRAIAISFVIIVHSMLHDGFYKVPISGLSMFGLLFVRNTSFLCVPLFLLLTGYLNREVTINKKYYSKIKKLIASYLLISVIMIVYKYFYFHNNNIIDLLLGIFNYSTIDYAWYFEMYIGLFLLIPFLNILYKNIKTQKEKQLLIITMLMVTSFGATISGFKIEQYNVAIMPNYWNVMYPITYYFIGSYINEYRLKMNRSIIFIVLISVLFLQTAIMYYMAYRYTFVDKISINYNNLFTIMEATLLFILLYNVEVKSKIIKGLIGRVSKVSFHMYLISVIFDFTVYKKLTEIFVDNHRLLIIPFIGIPIVFILSFLSANIIEWVVNRLVKKKNSIQYDNQ